MTFAFRRRRRRSPATRPAVVETEVARLLLLSLPASNRNHQTNGKR
jgi:hypothetical protein